nr:MAG TPA: hypothetical protein [Caudoviricetes sp.]
MINSIVLAIGTLICKVYSSLCHTFTVSNRLIALLFVRFLWATRLFCFRYFFCCTRTCLIILRIILCVLIFFDHISAHCATHHGWNHNLR